MTITHLDQLRAQARALWAVRVLDAWCLVGQEGYEGDEGEREWSGGTPDAARLAAAKAVFGVY